MQSVKITTETHCSHMTCQNSNFSSTHEEEQGISSASSFFTFPLTSRIVQILTAHVTSQCISVVVLTNVWPTYNPLKKLAGVVKSIHVDEVCRLLE